MTTFLRLNMDFLGPWDLHVNKKPFINSLLVVVINDFEFEGRSERKKLKKIYIYIHTSSKIYYKQ